MGSLLKARHEAPVFNADFPGLGLTAAVVYALTESRLLFLNIQTTGAENPYPSSEGWSAVC